MLANVGRLVGRGGLQKNHSKPEQWRWIGFAPHLCHCHSLGAPQTASGTLLHTNRTFLHSFVLPGLIDTAAMKGSHACILGCKSALYDACSAIEPAASV
eukprot:scaffold37400_cov20-Tisochrysis_lutea.AAC.2